MSPGTDKLATRFDRFDVAMADAYVDDLVDPSCWIDHAAIGYHQVEVGQVGHQLARSGCVTPSSIATEVISSQRAGVISIPS